MGIRSIAARDAVKGVSPQPIPMPLRLSTLLAARPPLAGEMAPAAVDVDNSLLQAVLAYALAS